MSRSFTTLILSLAVGLSVFVNVPIVFAQESSTPDGANQSLITGGTNAANASAADGTAVYNAPSSATDHKDVPNIPTSSSPPGEPMSKGVASAMSSIMTLFAWLLGVAVITLDNAVYYTVVKMGSVVNNLSAIGVAWRILRDIANIAFIFGFLAIGINTILGSGQYGWSSKLLPKFLIAAVLLNFSLFMTEAVIDAGNLFATQFYTQINGGQPAGVKDISISAVRNDGIANKIMNQLGLQTIYGNATTNSYAFEAGSSLIIGFMSIVLFLVTAFVMFTLAFILIARFVILVLLIVVAPIGFAGYAIPKLEGLASTWSSKLIEQTITAPILLLALYVALAVITDTQFLTGFGATQSDAWTSWIHGSNLTSFAGVFLSFIVAIMFLLAVVYLSKMLGALGADVAVKWAGRASFGAAALGMSTAGNTVGRLSRYGIQNTRLGQTGFGRGLVRYAARPLENARFDVRSVPGVGAGLRIGGVGAIATPVEKSASGRVQQGLDWRKTSNKAAEKQYDEETRVQTLSSLVTKGNMPEAAKAISKLSDDELKSDKVGALLTSNPTLIPLLSGAQVSKLPDKVLTHSDVSAALTAQQLETIRRAGNISPTSAQTIGLASLTGALLGSLPPTGRPNLDFAAWIVTRNTQQTADIRRFWGF